MHLSIPFFFIRVIFAVGSLVHCRDRKVVDLEKF